MLTLSGGASWLMQNGGTASLSGSVGGIGGAVQSFAAAFNYSRRF